MTWVSILSGIVACCSTPSWLPTFARRKTPLADTLMPNRAIQMAASIATTRAGEILPVRNNAATSAAGNGLEK